MLARLAHLGTMLALRSSAAAYKKLGDAGADPENPFAQVGGPPAAATATWDCGLWCWCIEVKLLYLDDILINLD